MTDELTLEIKQLRLAVQNLACAPQAQRRYVQLGWMRRAIDNLDRVGAQVEALVAADLLSAEQADLVAALRAEVLARMASDPGFLEEDASGPRDFLFGGALENPGWDVVRHQARRCHADLAGEDSVFMAIMAK